MAFKDVQAKLYNWSRSKKFFQMVMMMGLVMIGMIMAFKDVQAKLYKIQHDYYFIYIMFYLHGFFVPPQLKKVTKFFLRK